MDAAEKSLNLEALLAPISGASPVGPDLREDRTPQSLYFRLRDARAEARAEEREADKRGEEIGAPQQWRTVRQLALEAIGMQSKDLEITAWLTEAFLRLEGLRGCAEGTILLTGLIERYWSDLHPMPDEDGMATRVSPINGLNGVDSDGTLAQPLRKLTLFRRPGGDPLAFWRFEQSLEAEGMSETNRKQRYATGIPSLSDLMEEKRSVPREELAALRRDAEAALAAWTLLGEQLDVIAGRDSPPTRRIREILVKVRDAATKLAPPEADPPPDKPTAGEPASVLLAGVGTGVTSGTVPVGNPATREEMLMQLSRIADFFRRTEPHSPLAYTLDETVRRGRLGWPELLAEIMPDLSTRSAVLTTLGIRPPAEPE